LPAPHSRSAHWRRRQIPLGRARVAERSPRKEARGSRTRTGNGRARWTTPAQVQQLVFSTLSRGNTSWGDAPRAFKQGPQANCRREERKSAGSRHDKVPLCLIEQPCIDTSAAEYILNGALRLTKRALRIAAVIYGDGCYTGVWTALGWRWTYICGY